MQDREVEEKRVADCDQLEVDVFDAARLAELIEWIEETAARPTDTCGPHRFLNSSEVVESLEESMDCAGRCQVECQDQYVSTSYTRVEVRMRPTMLSQAGIEEIENQDPEAA